MLSRDEVIAVTDLFKPNQSFSLLYRATRDGWLGNDFHYAVDKQGPTLSIIKNQFNRVFGVYTEIPWRSKGGWTKGNHKTFHFYIDEEFNHRNTVKMFVRKNALHEVGHFPDGLILSEGPTVMENCHINKNSFIAWQPLMMNYPRQLEEQYLYYLIGSEDMYFRCMDIEVYKVF